MVPHPYSALATLIALAVCLWTQALVSRARTRFGVTAPAVTGCEEFERRFRIQMNTLEQLILMLPSLWLCALWFGEVPAAAGGLIWSVGRVIYALAYMNDPAKRGPGFALTILPTMTMMVATAFAVAKFLFA